MHAHAISILAQALTGDQVEVANDCDSVDQVLAQLSQAGWPADRIRSHAQACWADEQPWPHPVSANRLAGVGAAQWYAWLGQARLALRLDAVRQPPSQRTALTSEERRLMADRPPHHGPVG